MLHMFVAENIEKKVRSITLFHTGQKGCWVCCNMTTLLSMHLH
jgi:hypothetical protein